MHHGRAASARIAAELQSKIAALNAPSAAHALHNIAALR
jgi:hypothetical protein